MNELGRSFTNSHAEFPHGDRRCFLPTHSPRKTPTNNRTIADKLLHVGVKSARVLHSVEKKNHEEQFMKRVKLFFYSLSLSLASGNNLSLSDRSVHRGGKRSVQVAGTCFCLSFFLSFFFPPVFFSPISKLDDLGPWLDVCTSAGRSRDPDASEQKTLVETQE